MSKGEIQKKSVPQNKTKNDELNNLFNAYKRILRPLFDKRVTDTMITDLFNATKKFFKPERIGLTTYQQVERILKGYPILDMEVRLLEEQIERYTKHPEEFGHTYGRISKDVARFIPGAGMVQMSCYEAANAGFELAVEQLDEKKANFERLVESVSKIEHDEFFGVIEMYYFQSRDENEIAKALGINQSTVKRNRKRLITQLELIIFGMDCLK